MSAPDFGFMVAFCVLLILEFNGIASKRKNDTISEMAWWLRGHVLPLFLVLVVVLVWLPFHFAFGGH